jgi:hypothetical protein
VIGTYAHPICPARASAATRGTTINSQEKAMINTPLKLIALFTTIAMVALPIAEASAHVAW